MANVGDGIRAEPGSWAFGGAVAHRFDEHIARSVPYYTATHELIERLSDEFLSPGSRAYDLGCSTGALTARLAARHGSGVDIIGIDCEPEMVALARLRCAAYPSVTVVEADIADFEYSSAGLVVADYIFQFVAADARSDLLDRIARGMIPGAALLVFEKLALADPGLDALMTSQYHEWKRVQGFTDVEIEAKARSLEGVLVPLTSEANREQLLNAGFTEVITVFRWLNWEGFLAFA